MALWKPGSTSRQTSKNHRKRKPKRRAPEPDKLLYNRTAAGSVYNRLYNVYKSILLHTLKKQAKKSL